MVPVIALMVLLIYRITTLGLTTMFANSYIMTLYKCVQ